MRRSEMRERLIRQLKEPGAVIHMSQGMSLTNSAQYIDPESVADYMLERMERDGVAWDPEEEPARPLFFAEEIRRHFYPDCPKCGYPGHGEDDPHRKYMGIYRPGEPCGKCGFREDRGTSDPTSVQPSAAPEPDLPKRIEFRDYGGISAGALWPVGKTAMTVASRREMQREAARRYNEWPGLVQRVCDAEGEAEEATGRAVKAEAEVKRLAGVIDEYQAAQDMAWHWSQQEIERLKGETRLYQGKIRIWRSGWERRYDLLAAERDALKLAVQEGEAAGQLVAARLERHLLRQLLELLAAHVGLTDQSESTTEILVRILAERDRSKAEAEARIAEMEAISGDDDAYGDPRDLAEQLAAGEIERDRLKAALGKAMSWIGGGHSISCSALVSSGQGKCSCGVASILADPDGTAAYEEWQRLKLRYSLFLAFLADDKQGVKSKVREMLAKASESERSETWTGADSIEETGDDV